MALLATVREAARNRSRGGLLASGVLDFLFDSDIVISYGRKDGTTYASGLADSLTSKGFKCLLDQLGSDAGISLPARFLRQVARCRMMILVGSESATRSKAVTEEIETFAAARGTDRIAPIGFEGVTWETAFWYPRVEGLARHIEAGGALVTGVPGASIIAWLERRFVYTKNRDRIRRARNGALGAILVLAAVAFAAGRYAMRAVSEAKQAETRVHHARVRERAAADSTLRARTETSIAEAARRVALRDLDSALESRRRAEVDAVAAAKLATASRREAERQKAVADSRDFANQADLWLEDGPGSLDRALASATAAVETAVAENLRTLESETALRRALSLLPRLGASTVMPGPLVDLAMSPDGNVAAALDPDGRVHAFQLETHEELKVGEMPRLPGARHVSVSNGATMVAVASFENLVVFDVAKQSVWRVEMTTIDPEAKFAPFDYIEQLSLAPSGRQLAVVISSSVSEHERKVGRVSLVDLEKRRPIAHLTDGLDISINTVTFDTAGLVLVAGGADRTDPTSGLVVIWDLDVGSRHQEPSHDEEADANEQSAAGLVGDRSEELEASRLLVRVTGNVTALAVSLDPWRVAVANGKDVALWRRSPGGAFEPVRYLPLRFPARQLVLGDDGKSLALIETQEPPLEESLAEPGIADSRAWIRSVWDTAADPTAICLDEGSGDCHGHCVEEDGRPSPSVVPVFRGMPMVKVGIEPGNTADSSSSWQEALSPGARRKVAVVDGQLAVLDAVSGHRIATLALDSAESVGRLVFSPSGRYLAVAHDRWVSVFVPDARNARNALGVVEHTPCGFMGCVHALAFSADESWLATAGDNGEVAILDLRSGKVVQRIGHTMSVQALSFSGDSSMLATASHVEFFDAEVVRLGSGSVVRLVDAHRGSDLVRVKLGRFVTSLSFTEDDKYLIVSSDGAFVNGDQEPGCRSHAMVTRADDLLVIGRSRAKALSSFLESTPTAALQPWN